MTALDSRWGEAIKAWSLTLEADGKSPATIKGYVIHVERLAAAAGVGPYEVTAVQIAGWIGGQAWSQSMRRKVMVSLRSFYGWAVESGHVDWSPTVGVAPAEPKRPGPSKRHVPAGWADVIQMHLVSCRARSVRPSTITLREYYLRRLAECSADPWKVTTAQLEAWLANPEWAPNTKRSARTHVRVFYRWAEREGMVEHSPAARLESVRVPRGVPRPAGDQALATALLRADARERLMVLLAARAGLRVGEIASLAWADVSERHLRITGKGGHSRIVPLDPTGDLGVALQAHRGRQLAEAEQQRTEPETWVFPSSYGIRRHLGSLWVGQLISGLLPAGVTPHQLRHRFATRAYAATRDLRATQDLLGHAAPEITARYAAVPDGALLAGVLGAAD